MRIFDHGLLWTEMKTICPKCKCNFIYRPKDILEHIDYDFTMCVGNAYRYVKCPECKQICIYTDPTIERTYNDKLVGFKSYEDGSIDIVYDGGDEDGDDDKVYYDGGDEDSGTQLNNSSETGNSQIYDGGDEGL